MLLVGRQEGHPVCKKTEWWGAGVVICLERGADLQMAQLMPLPLTVSCFSKIQVGFTFVVLAHPCRPGKGPLNGCMCVFMLSLKQGDIFELQFRLFSVGAVERVDSGSDPSSCFVGLARQRFRDPGLAGVRQDVTAHQWGGKSTAARTQLSPLGVRLPHEAVLHRHAHCHDGNACFQFSV